jgi:tetratricopeptide (TPR) repeat protein
MTRSVNLLLALLAGPILGLGQQSLAHQSPTGLESLLAKAQQAQATGNYASAAEAYRKAVEIRPEVPELWANLGLMQQETGDFPGATESFLQSNRLNPALYVPNLFLGIEYSHSGEPMRAIPFLIKAERLNKTDPQAPLALGRAYVAAGKFDSAATELTRATALNPKLGPAWFTLGIARLDQVEGDARIITEEDKHSPFTSVLYAESLVKQARFDEAAKLYKTLLNELPQPPCIRSELGYALLRDHDLPGAAAAFYTERSTRPECGLALLGQAGIAIDRGDAGHASSLLNQLWDRDHGFFATQAAVLFDGASDEKASATLNLLVGPDDAALASGAREALVAAINYPNQPSSDSASIPNAEEKTFSASHWTAEQEYAAGHFAQCENRLKASPAPPSAAKLRLLAACAFFTGDYQRASGAANAARNLAPHSIEAFYWSIKANERLAFQALARFQQLEPNSARNHVLLADIYEQLERFDDAAAECQQALALAPQDPAAMLGLASAYLNNNNPAGAMKVAEEALERTPEDSELNMIVGEALMDQRQYSLAEPYLIKGLHAKPQMLPHIHALLGKVYAETNKTTEAIEQLKLGASSDVDGELHYLLSRLYRQIGDIKDATEALNEMRTIKEQREARGMKRVEDLDLSQLEAAATQGSVP